MFIFFMRKTSSMIIVPMFKRSLGGPEVYLFIFTIVQFATIYLHFVNYTFILTFAFKGTSSLILTIAFRDLVMLFFIKFIMLDLLMILLILGVQLQVSLIFY